ncbi:MAG: hypothetical protein N3F04_06875 [Candidatus Nezhaarchaeota archaeon]|nr:hypothetical protein [Candidatus Nezhaarchaeota archaeon]
MPTITIELSEDTYKKLKEEALAKGLTVDIYAASLIEDLIEKRKVIVSKKVTAPQQAMRVGGGIPDEFYQAFKKWWGMKDRTPFSRFVEQAVESGYNIKDVYEWSYKLWIKFEEREGLKRT